MTAGVYVVTNSMMHPTWRAVLPCLDGRMLRLTVMLANCGFDSRSHLCRRDIRRRILDGLASQANRDLGLGPTHVLDQCGAISTRCPPHQLLVFTIK